MRIPYKHSFTFTAGLKTATNIQRSGSLPQEQLQQLCQHLEKIAIQELTGVDPDSSLANLQKMHACVLCMSHLKMLPNVSKCLSLESMGVQELAAVPRARHKDLMT